MIADVVQQRVSLKYLHSFGLLTDYVGEREEYLVQVVRRGEGYILNVWHDRNLVETYDITEDSGPAARLYGELMRSK